MASAAPSRTLWKVIHILTYIILTVETGMCAETRELSWFWVFWTSISTFMPFCVMMFCFRKEKVHESGASSLRWLNTCLLAGLLDRLKCKFPSFIRGCSHYSGKVNGRVLKRRVNPFHCLHGEGFNQLGRGGYLDHCCVLFSPCKPERELGLQALLQQVGFVPGGYWTSHRLVCGGLMKKCSIVTVRHSEFFKI